MAIQIASELTTKSTSIVGEDDVPESEVWFSNQPTGKRAPGALLEAALRVGDDYLLFMTDDVPFEDFLSVVLLDDEFNVKDSARIGGVYSTGTFSSLELQEPHSVRFRFIGDRTWTVRVLDRPQLSVPFLTDPAGVTRPLRLTRHFTVHCTD